MGTLTHLGIVAVLTVAGCVAVLATVGWRSPYARNSAPEAAAVTACVVLIVWCAYAVSWTLTPAAGFLCLAGVSAIGRRHVATTLPRRVKERDFVEALSGKIGGEWTGQIDITYAAGTNTAVKVVTTVPGRILPPTVMPGIREVCEHDFQGNWTALDEGRTITVIRNPEDPRHVVPFKAVLREKKMLGDHVHVWVSDNSSRISAQFSPTRAGELARGEQKALVERQFREQFPAEVDQSWVFDWQLPTNQCSIVLTAFPRCVPHDALHNDAPQHELVIPVGVDQRNTWLQWPVWRMPHAFVCGGTGSGKSTSLAAKMVECGGSAIVSVNFKYSSTFDRFTDLPNMHVYCRTYEENLAAIRYVEDVMTARYAGTRPKRGGLDSDALVLLIVDECAEFWKRAPDTDQRRLLNILEKGREARIHVVLATQNVTARTFNTDALTLCDHREQWGPKPGKDMRIIWGERTELAEALVPAGVPGRGIVTGPDGMPTLCQGLFTPGTATDQLSPDEADALDALLDQIATAGLPAYERVTFAGDDCDVRVSVTMGRDETPPNPTGRGGIVTEAIVTPIPEIPATSTDTGKIGVTAADGVTKCDSSRDSRCDVCSLPDCDNPVASPRARYCSAACRQRASRARRR